MFDVKIRRFALRAHFRTRYVATDFANLQIYFVLLFYDFNFNIIKIYRISSLYLCSLCYQTKRPKYIVPLKIYLHIEIN